MYAIKVESSDDSKSVIERSMSSNTIMELIPVLIQIASDKYNFIKPMVAYMGNGKYMIFDLSNPDIHATVDITVL